MNGAHAQVYSTDESPVKYNAFDKDLQLWVAACLYKGAVDSYRMFVGEMDDETADRHYRRGHDAGHHAAGARGDVARRPRRVRRVLAGVAGKVHIDDTVREYLYPIAASRIRGVTAAAAGAAAHEDLALLITTGFLPQRFRDEMRLPWDAGRQRRFDRLMAVLRIANHLLAAARAAVPVQRAAQGSRLADQDRTPAGVVRQYRAYRRLRAPRRRRTRHVGHHHQRWLDGPVRRRGKGIGGAEPEPLVVDPYAEAFCRAAGGASGRT